MPAGIERPLAESVPRPRKGLGQNFLRDRSILGRILAAGEVSSTDEVLEIGPGLGALTEALTAEAGRVVAIELDRELFALLQRRLGARSNLELIHADALEMNPCDLFAGSYKVIANIPYYITGALLRHLLESECVPDLLVLMVQREVAERMTARPGRLSLLGVSVQRYADVVMVGRVPAGAFHPRPKVDSAIVRLVARPERSWRASAGDFFDVARAGFGQRRKQLVNSLAAGLALERAQALALLACAKVEPSRRAETLELHEWDALAAEWARLRDRPE